MRMSYKKGKDVKKKSNFGMLSVKAGIVPFASFSLT